MRYRFNRSSIDKTIQLYSYNETTQMCTDILDESDLSQLCSTIIENFKYCECTNFEIAKSVEVNFNDEYYVDTKIKDFKLAKGANYIHFRFDVSLPSYVDYTEFYIKLDTQGNLTSGFNTSVNEVSGFWEFGIEFVIKPQIAVKYSDKFTTLIDSYTDSLKFFENYKLSIS